MTAAGKKIYSTFEIAALLNVGPSTVISWINEGKIEAFRTPGRHRRVKKENLLAFLKQYEMPVPDELLMTLPGA